MKIAIIGSGISGLGAAYLLQQRHDVTVFEKNEYAGGHTHTHDLEIDATRYRIDTGFIVFNDSHYPHFIRLLNALGIASKTTQMSFGVKDELSGLEYNTTTVNTLFAQRSNLLKPAFWGMVRDLKRFYRSPHPLLSMQDPGPTVGEYLAAENYGALFSHAHLVPIAAALWSSPGKRILDFPAKYLAQFMSNHHMLNTDAVRPPWRVVQNGSNSYTQALVARLKNPLRLNAPVQRVERDERGVTLRFGPNAERFDAVVFACHSDQALAMLANPSALEQEILGGLKYQNNEVLLHTDTAIMPKRRLAWAAWNAHLGRNEREVCAVTYWMNLLQGIPSQAANSAKATPEFLVSLNSQEKIDPQKVLKKLSYSHPVYTHQTVALQRRRGELHTPGTSTLEPGLSTHRSYFCGAYWGFGFHEDGLRSAVDIAEQLDCGWDALD